MFGGNALGTSALSTSRSGYRACCTAEPQSGRRDRDRLWEDRDIPHSDTRSSSTRGGSRKTETTWCTSIITLSHECLGERSAQETATCTRALPSNYFWS